MHISADACRKARALPGSDRLRPMGRTRSKPLVRDAVAASRETWDCDVIVHRVQPVVPVAENYELLGYAPDAAARGARYTRYLSDSEVLRTHTSAMSPACSVRSLAPRPPNVSPEPVLSSDAEGAGNPGAR